jgi:hypothetical protein
MHEGGIRTFGLVRWPGRVPAGRVEDSAVVGAVDFLPTIAALAHVPVPETLAPDGEDLSALWLGAQTSPRHQPLHWEWLSSVQGAEDGYMPPPLCIREGEWKLFVDHGGKHAQLFNIPADPGEQHEVAASHPDVVASLTTKVLDWVKTLPPSPARDKLAAGAAGASGTAVPATKPKSAGNRPKTFAIWDKNEDGFLSKEEFIPHIADRTDAPDRFRRFDKDGDGRLSKEEFMQAGN